MTIKLSSLLDKYFDFIFSVIVTFFDASDAYTPLLSQNRTYIFCVLLLWVISSMPCTFMTISSFRGRLQMTCSHKGFSCIYFWKFIRIHLNKKRKIFVSAIYRNFTSDEFIDRNHHRKKFDVLTDKFYKKRHVKFSLCISHSSCFETFIFERYRSNANINLSYLAS